MVRPFVTGHQTIPDLLERGVRDRRAETFLIFEDSSGQVTTRSYGDMFERARRAAGLFAAKGVRAGDRVHVHLPNRPEFYDCWFGTALMGAAFVPTNPLLTEGEVGYVVEHARCRISVTSPEFASGLAAAQAHDRIVLDKDIGEAASIGHETRPGPLDVAAVLYTSGTTSRPKGVLVTHANYLYVGEVVAHHLRLQPIDRWLVVLPLFHANAQYYSTMSALVTGGSVALMERFSASNWGRQAHAYKATVASLFAAPIRMILAQPASPVDSDNSLRAVIFSQNVTESELKDFEHRFAAPLLQLYGMTETIAPPTINPLYGDRRNMSIGLPTLPARVRVIHDDGSEVSAGEVGELVVAGEPGLTLMAGYLDDPTSTRETIVEGWLHTGDNVRWSPEGYLYFVDRSKDMIKRAGENIAASEVEAVINAHPDVFDSAVVAVPDPVRDEAIKAFVVARAGAALSEADLVTWCAEGLAAFKVPSFVEFVDELPRTSVGKIQKGVLRSRERGEVSRP